MNRRWLLVDTLHDGTGAAPRHDVGVGIEDDRILAVRDAAEVRRTGGGDRVEHLPGTTLVPGMIDAHVHLLFTSGSDHTLTRRTFERGDDATLADIGATNAAEAVLGGVTTVRDCGDTRGIVASLRDRQRRGVIPGPRILTAGAPITTTTGHLNWCGNVVTSDEELVAAVHRLADSGVDLVKLMTSGGNMTSESDPLGSQFSDEQVALAVRTAHGRGLRVAAHAQNVDSIAAAVRGGVDTIEHCLWRDSTGALAPPEQLVELLAGTRSVPVVTFAGLQRALTDDAGVELSSEQRATVQASSPTGRIDHDFAWARDLLTTGSPLVVASDAGVRFTPFRTFLSSLRCAMAALGLTAGQAVATATSHAAAALGLTEVGTVRAGMTADLTLLHGASPDRLGSVVSVIQSGRTTVRDGLLVPGTPPPPGTDTAPDR
ncbi:amidohydrolase family protein [Microlunatus sp. Y2014]|uniref:amidohydrolase family protein n=1 Tax=Microlunatus sp. Y2014 TaxID=3418488 RepID=UPI003DA7280A